MSSVVIGVGCGMVKGVGCCGEVVSCGVCGMAWCGCQCGMPGQRNKKYTSVGPTKFFRHGCACMGRILEPK